MESKIYHVSDKPDITRFDPRPSPSGRPDGEIVWAVDSAHLHNYLLPRDCPRVTYYARLDSQPVDIDHFFHGTSERYVVAIEAKWFSEFQSHRLYLYELPAPPFEVYDAGAGYYISRESVTPIAVSEIDNLPAEMLRRGVELRIMPSLWKLHDAVAASSLQFSIIRMRNATPRPEKPTG